jgi:predicted Zn finger-like uncharacterized protein
MIVECVNCHAKYNVDDKKIPPAGVKVRCHKCQNILIIQKPEPIPPLITPVPPPEVKEPTPPAEVPSPPVAEEQGEPPPPPEVAPPVEVKPAEPKIAAPEMKEPATDAGVVIEKPEPPPAIPQLSEDDKKWQERARRLAKALASDLVLYNQDKVEQGLQEGTLAQLLGSEIRRSWEYYCQQIPKHIVESTDFFKEQLNKIVGKGKEIFK